MGSVRIEIVSDTVETVTTYSPYGILLAQTGTSGTVYGFTGEQYDNAVSLLFLRARYFNPYISRFMSVDPIFPDIGNPQSFNRYSYVSNDPVNSIDPTGRWRWRLHGLPIYHGLVEDYYEGHPFNRDKQLEYRIEAFNTRPDMFNSETGAVYEVEPWYNRFHSGHGTAQALEYVGQLNDVGQTLKGWYPLNPGERLWSHGPWSLIGPVEYDWSGTNFRLGDGSDWPGKLRLTVGGVVRFVADYVSFNDSPSGLVLYWFEPGEGIEQEVAERALDYFSKALLRPRNWNPKDKRILPRDWDPEPQPMLPSLQPREAFCEPVIPLPLPLLGPVVDACWVEFCQLIFPSE